MHTVLYDFFLLIFYLYTYRLYIHDNIYVLLLLPYIQPIKTESRTRVLVYIYDAIMTIIIIIICIYIRFKTVPKQKKYEKSAADGNRTHDPEMCRF